MRMLSIGRDPDCDIVVNDPTDQVSRRHALLRFYPWGKIEIVPQGRNQTFVNGVPLKNGIPYTVHRSDVVSLARVQSLNWDNVTNPYRKIRITTGSFLGVVTLMLAIIIIAPYIPSSDSDPMGETPIPPGEYGGVGGGASIPPQVKVEDNDTTEVKKDKNRFKFPQTGRKKGNVGDTAKVQKNEEPVTPQPEENQPTEIEIY